MKVGLIGSGFAGNVHLEALSAHPAVSSILIAENDPLQIKNLSNARYSASLVNDYCILLDNPDIEVVDICLPHDQHYPVVLQAFQAGKDVILEKPISNSIEEADAMIAAAKHFGRRFYVALNERFLPVHKKVKEMIQNEELGKIVLANLVVAGSELPRMDIPAHWKGTFGRAGGGALADSGTHVVDLAIDWFGLPDAVQSCMGRFIVNLANKADDTASLVMLYPDKIVNILVTYASDGQEWSETRSIWGQKGSLHVQIDHDQPLSLFIDKNQVPIAIPHSPKTWWVDSVKSGVSHALDCLSTHTPFSVTPEDARNVLQVIRTAYASASLNKTLKLGEGDLTPLYNLRGTSQ